MLRMVAGADGALLWGSALRVGKAQQTAASVRVCSLGFRGWEGRDGPLDSPPADRAVAIGGRLR
jgi:hypothetical protein